MPAQPESVLNKGFLPSAGLHRQISVDGRCTQSVLVCKLITSCKNDWASHGWDASCELSALVLEFFPPTLFIKSGRFSFLGFNALHKEREQGANGVTGAGSCWEKLSWFWSLCRDPSPEILFCHWKRQS